MISMRAVRFSMPFLAFLGCFFILSISSAQVGEPLSTIPPLLRAQLESRGFGVSDNNSTGPISIFNKKTGATFSLPPFSTSETGINLIVEEFLKRESPNSKWIVEFKEPSVAEFRAEEEALIKEKKVESAVLQEQIEDRSFLPALYARIKKFFVDRSLESHELNLESNIERQAEEIEEFQDRLRVFLESRSVSRTENISLASVKNILGALLPNTLREVDDVLSGEEDATPKIKQNYMGVFSGSAIEAPESLVEEIERLTYVKKVHEDGIALAFLNRSVPAVGAPWAWRINATGSVCNTTSTNNSTTTLPCLTGAGVKIAIIDTGVDYTHPDLGGCLGFGCKVVGGYDVVNDDADPMDDHGHGTHVAATAAGKDVAGVYNGVAPDASIVAYKVLDAQGSGYYSWIIGGIERAVDPNLDNDFSDRADVISMSLGGGGDPDDPMSQAVDNATRSGSVVVVAAGNWGPRQQSISSPGVAREALTVGAIDDTNNIVANFSSRGPVLWNNQALIKPDIVAPGVSICAAQWDVAWESRKCFSNPDRTSISGTSMATPHVAGAAAIVKQAHFDWTPEEIKSVLRNTAHNLNQSIFDQGYGLLLVDDAARVRNKPLVLKVDPLPAVMRNDFSISWSLSGNNFKSLTLSYANYPFPFRDIFTTTDLTVTSHDLRANDLSEGDALFRVIAEDQDGNKTINFVYTKLKTIEFKNTLDYDILRGGDDLSIDLSYPSGFDSFSLEYYGIGFGGNGIITTDTNDIKWDTRGLPTSRYLLSAFFNFGQNRKRVDRIIYLDTSLKVGWPQRINTCLNQNPCQSISMGNLLEPVVDDLDNDGDKEIIVYNKGTSASELLVYEHTGSLKWSWSTRTGFNTGLPIIADIDGDSRKEVIIFNQGGWYWEPDYRPHSELYVFRDDGTLVPGYPAQFPKFYSAKSVVADLDFDQKVELITEILEPDILDGVTIGSKRRLSIFSFVEGREVTNWSLPNVRWNGTIESIPAVGNFDNDRDLEIIISGPSEAAGYDWTNYQWINEGEIHVLNSDGSSVVGWPVKVPGVIFSSPAVGDIDRDGNDDIVVGLMYASDIFPEPALGGIYVFRRDGLILPGWPQEKGFNFWSSPSLGDVDGDEYLEIGASRLGSVTYLFKHDGSVLPGWPQLTSWQDYYSTVMGDVSGDGKPDLLTTSGSYYFGGEGGVYAWHADGTRIPTFPKATEVDAQAPATMSDIDNDNNIDIIASSNFDFDPVERRYKIRGSIYVWETSSTIDLSTMHWPTFHHDLERTGLWILPEKNLPAPSSLSASLTSSTQVKLRWIDNSINEAWFEIEKELKGYFGRIATTSANISEYSEILKPNTTYKYRVRACINNKTCSNYSNIESIRTLGKPNTPTNLSARLLGSNKIEINWRDTSNNEEWFEIRYDESSRVVGSVPQNHVMFLDSSLEEDREYHYLVRACHLFDCSDWSTEISARTLLVAPSGLRTAPIDPKKGQGTYVYWTDGSSKEDRHELEFSYDTTSFDLLKTLPSNTFYYEDRQGRSEDRWYRIRSCVVDRCSLYSDIIISNEDSLGIPAAPSYLSAFVVDSQAVGLLWSDDSSIEDYYEIQRGFIALVEDSDGTIRHGVGNFNTIATSSKDTVAYLDNSISSGETYVYRIRACAGRLRNPRCSAWRESNELSTLILVSPVNSSESIPLNTLPTEIQNLIESQSSPAKPKIQFKER